MDDAEREQLETRYWELEQIIQAIDAGRIKDPDLRGQCLEEQDEIEFKFGEDYFERRDA